MIGATPAEVWGTGVGVRFPDTPASMPALRLLAGMPPRRPLVDELPDIRRMLAPLGRDERGLIEDGRGAG